MHHSVTARSSHGGAIHSVPARAEVPGDSQRDSATATRGGRSHGCYSLGQRGGGLTEEVCVPWEVGESLARNCERTSAPKWRGERRGVQARSRVPGRGSFR